LPRLRRSNTARAHRSYRSMHHAHCTSSLRKTAGPRRVIRPRRSSSPDWNCRGTSPPYADTCFPDRNRLGSSRWATTASAVRGPSPGTVSRSRTRASARPIASSLASATATSASAWR
jgi:hypothetical protein